MAEVVHSRGMKSAVSPYASDWNSVSMIGHVQNLGNGRVIAAQEIVDAARCGCEARCFAVPSNLHPYDDGWQQNQNFSKAALESVAPENGVSETDAELMAVPNLRRKE